MAELKTLAKSDPQFNSYLMGSFSNQFRAIPMQSLNVMTESETVTFKIVPMNEIVMPAFFQKWAQILKMKNFVLLAFPIFILLVKAELDEVLFNKDLALLNILGCAFLLAAMNLRNDYRDHLSGLDRVHPDSGSRAIQSGWVSAQQAKRWSWVFMVIGAIAGLPALLLQPALSLVLAIAFILVGIMETSYRSGMKYRWSTEFVVFLFFGPLFTAGFQMGLGAEVDAETLFLGMISGWLAVFVIHIRNFEAIMVNNQAGFSNTVQSLGFERSKKLLWVWWLCLIGAMDVYHWLYAHQVWLVGFALVTAAISWMMYKMIRSIKSPVASNFRPALDRSYRLGLIVIAIWVIENLSYVIWKALY